MKDLIEQLREFDPKYHLFDRSHIEAADMLEQQAEEIAALQAKLSAMEAQEPVAWMMCGVDKETRLTMNRPSAEHRKLFTCIYPLYTAPKVIPLTDERIRLKEGEWPVIALGHGLVEVAEGWQGGTHALIFGRNGSGVIGAPTQPDRSHLPGETLAVVTFENAESLDVVAGKLRVLREKLAAHGIGGQQP